MAVNILHETDNIVIGQEQDGFRALAIMLSLASLALDYSQEPLFSALERMQHAIATRTYAICYERTDRKSPLLVPVAFVTWAKLSRPSETVFVNRLRPLLPTELTTGNALWVIDMVAQYGHSPDLLKFLAVHFKEFKSFKATRWRDDKIRVVTFKNEVKGT